MPTKCWPSCEAAREGSVHRGRRRAGRRRDEWWRANRDKAPGLFTSELEQAVETLGTAPEAGPLYGILDDTPMRRVQLTKTRCHIYYSVEAEEIVIHFVWGARRGDRPAPRDKKSSLS